jgi:uncharacterized protein (TIGR03905 family)
MIYKFKPTGVCSKEFVFDIDKDVIKSFRATGGCEGNLAGIAKLLKDQKIDKVIKLLQGTDCHQRGTSCPDQIAIGLIAYKKKSLK